jgi:hypothetical protein
MSERSGYQAHRTGLGHGGHQRWLGDMAHRCLEDRDINAEKPGYAIVEDFTRGCHKGSHLDPDLHIAPKTLLIPYKDDTSYREDGQSDIRLAHLFKRRAGETGGPPAQLNAR